MPVPITYATGAHGNAIVDFDEALAAAAKADDRDAGRLLRRLLFDYIHEDLASLAPDKLVSRLAPARRWRTDGEASVFKTVDTPCVAFTLLQFDDGLRLVVLGFRYHYSTTAEAWWSDVIQPRLRLYL